MIISKVQQWFDIFEQNSDAYELTFKQMYVHARGKMAGTAKWFLQSVCVNDYNELKRGLIDEFASSANSADVHRQLQNRKKQKSETFHEYILQLRQIAAAGKVEESAILRYVVNGLVDMKNEYKAILYSCKTLKSLREQYGIIEQLDDKPRRSWNQQKKTSGRKNFVSSVVQQSIKSKIASLRQNALGAMKMVICPEIAL
ncbi:uncharacterized protein LOC123037224 [Drosophila rhopaloa]|uniref:Retrotransposon gag domain-containing protein n=1 Tax=Drosophila rhopaloa TaxID=1041015 RepID=A0ABM5J2A5_DRORH|nr:uncharacterized protein LOC123037224 [Drosophila rhopaloa]